MEEGLYQYNVDLKLYSGLGQSDAEALTDALYDASRDREPTQFRITHLEDEVFAVEVNGAIFEGNTFELALLNFAWMIQPIQYSCIGWGQRFFYKIDDGVLYDCGTIQEPDNEWQPFGRWLRNLTIERSEHV